MSKDMQTEELVSAIIAAVAERRVCNSSDVSVVVKKTSDIYLVYVDIKVGTTSNVTVPSPSSFDEIASSSLDHSLRLLGLYVLRMEASKESAFEQLRSMIARS